MTDRRLPERVVLSGIGYRVQESEGLIVFTDDNAMIGRPPRRFSFHRENLCWYLQLQTPMVMMSHISRAMELVEKAYGKNHQPV